MKSPLSSDPPSSQQLGAATHRGKKPWAAQPHPTLAYEREFLLAGVHRVAGIDEVGRGALAGPVAAAAVVLPPIPRPWYLRVNDSKLLTAPQREALAELILAEAEVGLAMVPPETIDSDGIAPATRKAMFYALQALGPNVDALLIDGFALPESRLRQRALVHGDQLSLSIACASIVAKVARDRLMHKLNEQYPGYGISRSKGYGTQAHLDALARRGPSPIHRRSFLINGHRPTEEAVRLSQEDPDP